MALARFVCASANPDKVAEIATLLDGLVELLPRPQTVPDVVEDAGTLVGNARLKATALCVATGLPAISDDTGLEVDALGGEPGVDTAIFAGPGCSYADNRHKLLTVLDGVPGRERGARFRTVAMVVWPDGTELVVEGVCEGTISLSQCGERGFGYDSLFVPADGDGQSFAQMSDEDKHALSHRGRAFRGLVEALKQR